MNTFTSLHFPNWPFDNEKLVLPNSNGDEAASIRCNIPDQCWQVTTLPVLAFASKMDAYDFYILNCDPETGQLI